jgi:hypothetical protein
MICISGGTGWVLDARAGLDSTSSWNLLDSTGLQTSGTWLGAELARNNHSARICTA